MTTRLQALGFGHSPAGEVADDANFGALADAVDSLVCVATLDGHVRFLNRAGRQYLGLNGSPAGAHAVISDFVDSQDCALMASLLTEAVAKGCPQHAQIRVKHKQTNAVSVLSCELFRLRRHADTDALTAAIVGRALGEGGGQPQTDPPGAARLAEMFAGVVGHDLRNPLNAILTGAHLVISQTDDVKLTHVLSRLIASGHRMQRMIDQLLDVTRIRSGGGIPLQLKSHDLFGIVQQQIQEARAAAPDWQIDLIARGDTVITCDADRLAQMISNLVGNATQHGARAAGVRVSVDGTKPAEVEVSVHNEGTIPGESLPVLFNPFRIVHEKRDKSKGLGLGLYVTRQIALAHGGEIEVTSLAEAGTTFRVRLPRRPTETRPSSTSLEGAAAEEMEILQMLAAPPAATSITAQLFGAVPLHERAPGEYWHLFERYSRLLGDALDRHTYKTGGAEASRELRDVAEQLGGLGAGAREVAELHARALRQKTRGVTVSKAQALTAEGRLVSFELMGHLLSFYRRRSRIGEGGL